MEYSVSNKGYYYRLLAGGDKIRISQEEFMNNQEVFLSNDKQDIDINKKEGGIIQLEKTEKNTFCAILISGIVLLFTGVISGL